MIYLSIFQSVYDQQLDRSIEHWKRVVVSPHKTFSDHYHSNDRARIICLQIPYFRDALWGVDDLTKS